MSHILSRQLSQLRSGDHLCVCYSTERQHRALVTQFLLDGIARHEKVCYFLHEHTLALGIDYLHNDLNVGALLRSGQLVLLEAERVYLPNGTFSPELMIDQFWKYTQQALAEGYAALRGTGEMTWALKGHPGSERLMEYESKLADFFAHNPCVGLCQYRRTEFPSDLLCDVLLAHPTVAIGTTCYDHPYYLPPVEFLPSSARREEMKRLWNTQGVSSAQPLPGDEAEEEIDRVLTSLAN